MMSDWNEAAKRLKREVGLHGGFLTMQRDEFRERFDIGRLTAGLAEDLLNTLEEHGMIGFPNPYEVGTSRIYDIETEIGKLALAVIDPPGATERALADAVNLYMRAEAGKRRRSVSVPWLSAFDVFLQLVVGKSPDGWEELDDEREPYKLVKALANSLKLPDNIVEAKETICMAGAVCACRPRVLRWKDAPALDLILAEAERKQKYIFDEMLKKAAKHLLGGAEPPSCAVDLGLLGLRYRHQA
jgi:hypothetical protein